MTFFKDDTFDSYLKTEYKKLDEQYKHLIEHQREAQKTEPAKQEEGALSELNLIEQKASGVSAIKSAIEIYLESSHKSIEDLKRLHDDVLLAATSVEQTQHGIKKALNLSSTTAKLTTGIYDRIKKELETALKSQEKPHQTPKLDDKH